MVIGAEDAVLCLTVLTSAVLLTLWLRLAVPSGGPTGAREHPRQAQLLAKPKEVVS